MRLGSTARMIAVAAVVGIAAAACGGGGNGTSTTAPSSATSTPASIPTGGSIVLGAEQWPQCLNPITSCSFASWYFYTTEQFVLPRMLQYDLKGNLQPSLATEVPSLSNGGLTESPFSVTYKIDPKAVWNDGTPITCSDVDFTWKAILNTTGAVSTVGYDEISGIDCSDPATVKISFKQVYVDWADLFGGTGGPASGFVLEKSKFPSVSADKPDLAKEMNKDLPFSGGPWVLQSWSKTQGVLVRNDKYWGHKPYLDQVTFVPREDQATEINSLLSGEVSAIYPQPTNVSLLDQFKQSPAVKGTGGNGNYDEALWINNQDPLMKDLAVRQALAYATDRQSVIDGVIKLNNPQAEVQNCGLTWFPGVGPWCPTSGGPFSKYTYDPNQVATILQGDGWAKGSDGIFAKGGQKLTITIDTTAGNARRQAIATLLQDKYKAAGIDMKVKYNDPTDLFSNKLPKGDYQVALYANGGVLDPSVTANEACDQFPTKENNYSGGNTTFWCNEQATQLMKQSDQELDVTKRAQEIQQIGQLQADDVFSLPIEVLPNVCGYRSDKIAGPVCDYISSPYGMFFNMDQWYIPTAG